MKTDDTHQKTTDAEFLAGAQAVSDFARSLGLHGVLILSPICANCGMAHDFRMLTDMGHREGAGNDVSGLLLEFAQVALDAPTTIIDAPRVQ